MTSVLEAVEEDADVEPETAGEVALAAGDVEKPVGLDYQAEFGSKGYFHAGERGYGHECISVHGRLRLGDEVICRAFGYDVVLHSASSCQAAYEWMYTALAAVDVIHEQSAPSGVRVGRGGPVGDIGTVTFGSYAYHVSGCAERELDVTADAGGPAFDLHGYGFRTAAAVQLKPAALDVAAVQQHASRIAPETECGTVGLIGCQSIQGYD